MFWYAFEGREGGSGGARVEPCAACRHLIHWLEKKKVVYICSGIKSTESVSSVRGHDRYMHRECSMCEHSDSVCVNRHSLFVCVCEQRRLAFEWCWCVNTVAVCV